VKTSKVQRIIQQDKDTFKKVNRLAVRFVVNNYEQQSTITAILRKLEWPSLEHLCPNQHFFFMYKIVIIIIIIIIIIIKRIFFKCRAIKKNF